MKLALLTITFLASAAFACPGGHIKTLAFVDDGDQSIVVAEINMITNRVKVADASELLSLRWQPQDQEILLSICGTENTESCDFDQRLGIKLLKNPGGILLVSVRTNGTVRQFKTTHFVQTRALCGETVLPDTPE